MQLSIPSKPSTSSGGPLSAPAPPSSSSSSSSRLFLPGQFSSPASQSPGRQLQVPGQRAVPHGLPESPEPPVAGEWDDYGLPAWVMQTLRDADESATHSLHGQNQETQSQNVFSEIDTGTDMGLPPWMSFGSMGSMSPMGAMGGSMDGMGPDGERMDAYAMHFQFEDLLDQSKL